MDKKKILIIDDEAGMIEMMTIRLEDSGYDVITADNGIEGLEKAKNEDPDLILLDVRMPQMDGHTMLRNLKKFGEKTKPIPVIIVTGSEQLRDLFDLEGAADYVVKPVNDEELLAKIEVALRQKG